MRRHAVILAGGEGSRAGSEMPKQFVKLLGIPMLWWSVRAFHAYDPNTEITLVMHPGFFDDWDIIYSELPEEDRRIPLRVVSGGRNRTHSVLNGIMELGNDSDTLIAIHDAARPVIDRALIERVWRAAEEKGAVVPCCPEVNSLRVKEGDTTVPVDRSLYLTVQTPQAFRADILQNAYSRIAEGGSYTDDASLVESAGYRVDVCMGDPANIKVTTPDDFTIVEALLAKRAGALS